jgi:hypothetical protein
MTMTPMQTSAMQDPGGCTLATPPIMTTLSVIHSDGRVFWQCSVSIKRDDDAVRFSHRDDILTDDWTDEMMKAAAQEAEQRLDGAGKLSTSSVTVGSSAYILTRDIAEDEIVEFVHRR